MKNWWEEDEEFDFSGGAQDPFEAEKSADDKSFEEVFGASFDEMPLRQQIETAYDYYDKPQNGQAYQIAGEPVETMMETEKSENSGLWNKAKNIGGHLSDMAQAASVGYVTGLSLGNFDEAMGGATAMLTGYPQNYKIGRNATRQLQQELKQNHPYIYGGSEFLGAMQSPMHLFKGATAKQKAFNALTDTLSASSGYAENAKDFGENLLVNGMANGVGLSMESAPTLRAIGATGKKFIKQGINFGADKVKNKLYDDEEDE